jgi:FkbM family methyltransferase
MLREVLERASRNIVFKRRLPARVGGQYIYVSPDSALKFWKWNLEYTDSALFDWAAEFVKPGDVVWDIGANVGLFAFAAASLAGRTGTVLAIEPDPNLAEMLRRSASDQPSEFASVTVLPVAVSDQLDVAEFNIAARGRSANHLANVAGSSQTGGVRETIRTITVTLDWLMERFPAPRVLKIDVEGSEERLLRGASKVLSVAHPLVLCEVYSCNARKVQQLFSPLSYTLFDLEVAPSARKPIDSPSFNTLAI